MKVEVDIPDEAVDEIVLRELKIDYEMNNRFEQDVELANALLTVIKYHSTDQQYHDWIAGNKNPSKHSDSNGNLDNLIKVCCESHGGPVGLHCNHDHCTGPKWIESKHTTLSDTRKRRLLTLVANSRDTKQWYHLMYYPLIIEGYVSWCLGHGTLTEEGKSELERLMKK